MAGFIKVPRIYFSNFLWKEARIYSKAEAALDLIQHARFEASTEFISGKVIELQEGEIPASRRYLEKRWQWGSSKVDSFIKLLINMGMISRRQTNGQTVYRIESEEYYNTTAPPTAPLANHQQTSTAPNNRANRTNRYNPLDYLLSQGATTEKAEAWIHYRRVVKKASVSKVVVDGIIKVAQEVNINLDDAIEMQEKRNWQGFKASWIINSNNQYNGRSTTNQSSGTRSAAAKEALYAELAGQG